jgi:hypothetical protein
VLPFLWVSAPKQHVFCLLHHICHRHDQFHRPLLITRIIFEGYR